MTSVKNTCLEFQKAAAPLVLTERTLQDPPARGLIIKIAFCGVCHSDINIWREPFIKDMTYTFPKVLGHEMSGFVHSIGSDSVQEAADFRAGDPVVLFAWGGCRNCAICDYGDNNCRLRNASDKAHQYGYWMDGGYQEYVTVEDRRMVIRVPDSVPMSTAAVLTCGGITAYNAISNARDSLQKNITIFGFSRVLVIGAGGLGLWAITLLKAMFNDQQLKIVAADVNNDCLTLASDAGAHATVLLTKDGCGNAAGDKIKECLEGGMDAVLDFVNTTRTVDTAFHSCNKVGYTAVQSQKAVYLLTLQSATIVLIGLLSGTMPPLDLPTLALSNIRIQGIYTGTLNQLKELLQFVADKKITSPPQKEISLNEVNHVYQKMMEGNVKGRYVIKM